MSASTNAPRKKSPALAVALGSTVLVAGGAGVVGLRMSGSPEGAAAAPDSNVPLPPARPGAVLLEPFLVNVRESPDAPRGASERYLRVSLRIELDRAEVAEAASVEGLANTRLRDRILVTLGGHAADELRGYEGREALRAELLEAIQPLFERARVLDVYFQEFLVQ